MINGESVFLQKVADIGTRIAGNQQFQTVTQKRIVVAHVVKHFAFKPLDAVFLHNVRPLDELADFVLVRTDGVDMLFKDGQKSFMSGDHVLGFKVDEHGRRRSENDHNEAGGVDIHTEIAAARAPHRPDDQQPSGGKAANSSKRNSARRSFRHTKIPSEKGLHSLFFKISGPENQRLSFL